MTRDPQAPVLLADIGGTNARFALHDRGRLVPFPTLAVADHATFESAMEAALAHAPRPPVAAVLAVAGPVDGDRVALTNSAWEVDGARLRARFGLRSVRLVNDFAAVAWSLPALAGDDLATLAEGTADPDAPCVALGPGTGLGTAAYLPQHGGMVVAGEGGHATLPAADRREDAVVERLRRRFGHVSVERVLSGDGLSNLYEAIAAEEGIAAAPRDPEEITAAARDGSCAVCRAAVEMLCAMLGGVAGNLALTLGARGGVYIAGGIMPRLRAELAASAFRERFVDKGRFREWLEGIPVHLIIHPAPALVGLARLAGRADSDAPG